jgi:lysozyme family protein
MEISKTDGSEAQIRTLEKKVQDMEPLVNGLIEETIDLRAVFLRMLREAEEFGRQERNQETIVWGTASLTPGVPTASLSDDASTGGSTGIQPGDAPQSDVPAAPAEHAMVMIMQADGTMKMEPRCGDRNQTDSTAGYGPARMAHLSRATRKP